MMYPAPRSVGLALGWDYGVRASYGRVTWSGGRYILETKSAGMAYRIR